MNGKTTAIVSHITLIGLIIALVANNKQKDDLASFYIRQNLGLILCAAALSMIGFIPVIGLIATLLSLGLFVLWIISIINAVNEKQAPLPIVGEYFQDWFKTL